MPTKNQIVAIEFTRTTFYANFGKPGEAKTEWTLARVASASRDGIVKAIEQAGAGFAQKLAHMAYSPRVHCISDQHQPAADRLFRTMDAGHAGWESPDALRAAITT